jgi:hypothetical protein
MPLSNLLSRDVIIIRRSASDLYDEYGNEGVPDEAMTATVGELQQRSGTESEQTVGVSEWLLVLAPDVDIDNSDIVEVDGQRYEVTGPPDVLHSIVTHRPDHIEVALRYSGGAPEPKS